MRPLRVLFFLLSPVTFYIISVVIHSSNSAWAFGRYVQSSGDTDTEFEFHMRALGLTKDTCLTSWELRRWCEANRNRHYIPERLLDYWGIPVDPDYS